MNMSPEDNLMPLVERSSAIPEPEDSARTSKKRKRGALKQDAKKGAKRPKATKEKAHEDKELEFEAGINAAFANMDSQLLADYVAQRTRSFENILSSVELEDKYLPGKIF